MIPSAYPQRLLRVLVVASAVAVLSGCGLLSKRGSKEVGAGLESDALYAEAREEAASGNLDRAAKLYEKLEGRAAGGVLGQQAQLERAWLLYRSNDKATALAVLDRFIRLNPSSPGLDYALYLKGLVNFNDNLGFLGSLARQDLSERDQQASRDSFLAFRQLVEQFPQSIYAPDAQLRMDYIVGSLAAYELHVARYYFRRGAYLAAVNRAQQALRDFPQTQAAREALQIMVQSYDRLGLTQLRDDARRVLELNAGDAQAASGRNRKPWWQLW